MKKEEIRILLNDEMKQRFDDITLSRVLGANKQIDLIIEMIVSILDDTTLSKEELISNIKSVAYFFQETRGQNSRAIYNAIALFLSNLDEVSEHNIVIEKMKNGIQSYHEKSLNDTKKIVEFATSICENLHTIMIFDYSSTVNEFVKGLKHEMTIYIPESRALNGGKPFVKDAVEGNHKVHFIPDTTIFHFLKECDAAFMGAETIYPDGTVFNTIGSDLVAVSCKYQGVPFYALTPLMKIDVRPVYGHIRLSPMSYDFKSRLASDWDEELSDRINFEGIKLISVKPELITAIICEEGIIPSTSLFEIAMNYNRKLENNLCQEK